MSLRNPCKYTEYYGDLPQLFELVVVVLDLYSASSSASNSLNVLLRRKKTSFQRRSEAVGTPSRVPERVRKRVHFHRTRSGESPTTKRAATVSWNHQLAIVGFRQMFAGRARLHLQLGSVLGRHNHHTVFRPQEPQLMLNWLSIVEAGNYLPLLPRPP